MIVEVWREEEEQSVEKRRKRSARRRIGGGRDEEEETKKKQPSKISEMTDTRFHPVEVTTMFVSRRYMPARRQPFHHVSRLN